jgi:RNA-directed DNA polymerase
MTTALNALARKAQTDPKHRFQNLYGELKADALYRGWLNLNKQSAAGIDSATAMATGRIKARTKPYTVCS